MHSERGDHALLGVPHLREIVRPEPAAEAGKMNDNPGGEPDSS
jgi:hypothetical protein